MPSDTNATIEANPSAASSSSAASGAKVLVAPPAATARGDGPCGPAGDCAAPPCSLVIFGAGGDLTKRLLVPALYNLVVDGLLDNGLQVIGVNRGERGTDSWRDDLHTSLQQFAAERSSAGKADEKSWNWLAQRMHYIGGDFASADTFERVKQQIASNKAGCGNAIFYLAVGERFFKPVVEQLGKAGLLDENAAGGFRRVVIEKPFGNDLASARDLNAHILTYANEQQIYRIDHFLGKETVQSILAVRFANALFEPVWRREYIDSVQITASETLGVEGRGAFYDNTGAFRDMLPNHLFQLLAMVAMEPPTSFDAETVRDKKAEVSAAIQPLRAEDVVLGQYAQGPAGVAYRTEPNVAPDSTTETYAAACVHLDNWRWAGVPFYLRTGKRLATRRTEIAVQLKRVPFLMFRDTPVDSLTPNVLTLRIDPAHGTRFDFNVKVPGPTMKMGRVRSTFDYKDFFKEEANVGYETLLYDCMRGDETLFQRADSIEASWAAVDGVLHPKDGALPVHDYAAGGSGPAEADALLARTGHAWRPLDDEPKRS
ncbi:glucose-6-phosphate dehydrogenase [Paraburkholderia solisilvae]|uniref:Glucose-6-phosphate 1-dehydrogenase n=1 Tax=Paraburkholderia solisilvae TaxID=624376 RepID=A0A6J5EEH2_9BURK|nr:glucose-6-phosphate dehydrogenase [Paraburkholderia solisilvae]CAB3763636.1 Glucose-6-phosphate 1-dehydrogenase [Paraburkholderia solisilvae]